MADDPTPPEGQEEPGIVETPDGVEHVGEVPAAAARTKGWYRSPSGAVAHADGPSQVRAFVDRGYTPIEESEAREIVARGVQLVVDRSDSNGTFDAESVDRAVKDEAPPARRPARRRRG